MNWIEKKRTSMDEDFWIGFCFSFYLSSCLSVSIVVFVLFFLMQQFPPMMFLQNLTNEPTMIRRRQEHISNVDKTRKMYSSENSKQMREIFLLKANIFSCFNERYTGQTGLSISMSTKQQLVLCFASNDQGAVKIFSSPGIFLRQSLD